MKAVAVIIKKENKLLLSQRSPSKKIEPNKWENIGGSVEEGESFEQAIKREVKKEIGVELTNLKIALEYKDNHGEPEVILNYAEIKEEPNIMEPEECSELKWFSIYDLDKVDLAKYTLKDFVKLKLLISK